MSDVDECRSNKFCSREGPVSSYYAVLLRVDDRMFGGLAFRAKFLLFWLRRMKRCLRSATSPDSNSPGTINDVPCKPGN